MISNELIEKIIYISSKGKLLDKKTILELAVDILNSLDEYTISKFNGIIFDKPSICDKYSYASLNKNNGKIKIYLDEINKKKFNSILEKNLMLVESLIHEFKHLEESKKILVGDFESLLLMASDNNVIYESLLKNKQIEKALPNFLKNIIFLKYYYKIYSIIPAERIADIEAFNDLFEGISKYPNFKIKHIEEYKSIKEKTVGSYFRGYKFDGLNYSVPLIEYFKKIDNLEILNIFEFYKNNSEEFIKKSKEYFSLKERLKYGLPIEEKDRKKIYKKLITRGEV